MTTHILTQDELKLQLHYDPETGIFVRLETNPRCHNIRNVVGHIHRDGYVFIGINGRKYPAHRLAWLYMNGEFPPNATDHINGVRNDNRLCNLREATWKQNNQNARKKSNSGLKLGVRMCRNKYQASITVNRKSIHLGTFDTEDLAYLAYVKAKRELHEFCTL